MTGLLFTIRNQSHLTCESMKVNCIKAIIASTMAIVSVGLFADEAETMELRHPQTLHVVSPSVPYELSRANVEGDVKVLFRIDESGRPHDIRIESASHVEYANSVKSALRSWRFEQPEQPDRLYGMPFLFR